ncbi:glutathione ABC transporter substrate-binding protein [Clostridia bacterium]|nr:glutathione ABC transporter substrate-binding protein [Clostridia bacterium]
MNRYSAPRRLLTLVMSLALVMVFALGGTASAAVSPDKLFNIVITASYTGFDPLRTNDSVSTYVNAQLYETLYRLMPNNEFACLLAAELPEFAEDGLSATIKLREGVNFHDGTPFNAEAFQYTYSLIKDPAFGSSRASLVASIDSVDIVDEYTVRLNLGYTDGVLLAKLAHTNFAIVSPTAQKKQDLMIDPVGTGAYKFVSAISGADVVLEANEDYWGGAPAIKNVKFTIVPEESTAIARLETGEADFLTNVSVPQISRVESIPEVTFGASPAAAVTYFHARPTSYVNPLMANKEFRIALAMALDSQGYTDYMMEGYAEHSNSMIGPRVFGYTEAAEEFGYRYDPEGARKIVEENGWQDEPLVFLIASTPAYMPLGEYFQANLTAAGFNNVHLELLEWSAFLTETQLDNRFDIALNGWSNVTRDGTELLEPNFETKASSKRTRVDSAELDQLILESKTTVDRDVRLEKLEAGNKFLLDEADVVPVYNAQNLFAYNNAYTGIIRDVGGTFYIQDFGIAE